MPSRSRKYIWIVVYPALSLVIVLAIAYFFWIVPSRELRNHQPSLQPKDYLELEGTIRAGLAQAIGGTAILLGLFFTWRNIRATERNLETSYQTSAKNLSLAHEGQITERFTKAIDQLGSEKLQVRLGGIYALERIARDSKPDYWPVVEILTAFVRANSTTQLNHQHNPANEPATDIQAVLTVLTRRNINHEKNTLHRIDLRGANLRGANLIGCDLKKAILWNADLSEANLRDSSLQSAGLRGARLNSAALTLANLEAATLFEANLDNAVCAGASMEGVQLAGASLRAAQLYDVNLSGANLFQADLTGASLLNANLTGAILNDAILAQANLQNADLSNAIGLTVEQVRSGVNFESAKLPFNIVPNRDLVVT